MVPAPVEGELGSTDALLAQLVKRVSDLEKRVKRNATFDDGGGNMKILGGFSADMPTWDTEATSYTDLGGNDVTAATITKKAADTDLIVLWWWDGFRNDSQSSGGGGAFTTETGIQVGASDFGSWPFRWNVDVVHEALAGFTAIPGIAAGDHVVQIRVRNTTADHSVETNSSSHAGWLCIEVPSSLSYS